MEWLHLMSLVNQSLIKHKVGLLNLAEELAGSSGVAQEDLLEPRGAAVRP